MHTPSIPDDLGRLRENLIDLDVALTDAIATLDPDDPLDVAHLAELSDLYRAHRAALARHELHEVPGRG